DPEMSSAAAIARGFGVTIDELLGPPEPAGPPARRGRGGKRGAEARHKEGRMTGETLTGYNVFDSAADFPGGVGVRAQPVRGQSVYTGSTGAAACRRRGRRSPAGGPASPARRRT